MHRYVEIIFSVFSIFEIRNPARLKKQPVYRAMNYQIAFSYPIALFNFHNKKTCTGVHVSREFAVANSP